MKSGVVEEKYKAQIEESDGEELEHGCNYMRLWKDPLTVASPVHVTYLRSQCRIICMKYHHCLVVSQRRKIEDHEGYKGLRMMREREREI
jgi:hypothetical protein